MCVGRASHYELANLCSEMISTQRHEIAHLETWLCESYHRCGRHWGGPRARAQVRKVARGKRAGALAVGAGGIGFCAAR